MNKESICPSLFLYLDGNGIDEHFGFISKKKKHYFITDHLGSALNDEASGGSPLFGPFGEKFDTDSKDSLKKHSVPVIYGFSGRQLDPESSTYYFRARTYNPDIGRFMSKDPSGFAGGDINLYRYTRNSPVNFEDPSGECLFSLSVGAAYTAGGFGSPGAGQAESIQYGYVFDTSSFSLSPYTQCSSGTQNISGAYFGAGFGLGFYDLPLEQFYGNSTTYSTSAGLGQFGFDYSGNSSGGSSTLPGLSLGLGAGGATQNSQTVPGFTTDVSNSGSYGQTFSFNPSEGLY